MCDTIRTLIEIIQSCLKFLLVDSFCVLGFYHDFTDEVVGEVGKHAHTFGIGEWGCVFFPVLGIFSLGMDGQRTFKFWERGFGI